MAFTTTPKDDLATEAFTVVSESLRKPTPTGSKALRTLTSAYDFTKGPGGEWLVGSQWESIKAVSELLF